MPHLVLALISGGPTMFRQVMKGSALLTTTASAAVAEQLGQSAPSPDVIKSLTDLLQAAGHVEDTSLFSSEHLHAAAEILGTIVWPSVIVVALIVFRTELKDLIRRIKKVGIGGTSIEAEEEIQKKVDLSAAEVLSSPNSEPPTSVSTDDVRRAVEVAALSQGMKPEVIRSQIGQISAEYEGIRATMPSSSARTLQMGAVMAKMRTLGRAVFPYRYELVSSPSPGRRLFAIAALQMLPDYNLLDWLASTTKVEAPYVQYQALNALKTAVRNAGPEMKASLKQAVIKAKSGLSQADPDISRWTLACAIEEELARIPDRQTS